ncbi:MAG: ABC transporter ATP-binding protein [Gammaproteobacteria bacterium]
MAASSTTRTSTTPTTTEHARTAETRDADTAAAPVLALRGIAKRYRGRDVLDGLDLTLGRGEIVGLLGPNGSGKTTTLRIAAGLLWPDRGSVTVAGEPLTPDCPGVRSHVGYLPERVPLDDALTVSAFLAFVAGARGLPPARRRRAVATVLESFDLGAVAGRVIGRLSKGFRQRVGLAQALLGEPGLLLLDEPSNGLDPFQVVEARTMIRRAAADRAVIFSTHVLQEVAALCTRVVYLHQGRLLSLPAPATAATAGMRALVRGSAPAPLLAALHALDPALAVAPPRALAAGRWELDIELGDAGTSVGEVARVLATAAVLEALIPRAFDLEAALAGALAKHDAEAVA